MLGFFRDLAPYFILKNLYFDITWCQKSKVNSDLSFCLAPVLDKQEFILISNLKQPKVVTQISANFPGPTGSCCYVMVMRKYDFL